LGPSVSAVPVLAAVVVGVDDHPGSSFVEFVSFRFSPPLSLFPETRCQTAVRFPSTWPDTHG
jgi:hypothetical protein